MSASRTRIRHVYEVYVGERQPRADSLALPSSFIVESAAGPGGASRKALAQAREAGYVDPIARGWVLRNLDEVVVKKRARRLARSESVDLARGRIIFLAQVLCDLCENTFEARGEKSTGLSRILTDAGWSVRIADGVSEWKRYHRASQRWRCPDCTTRFPRKDDR